jgi:hypothetical protein
MPIPLNYTEIESLFSELQISTFDAALPEGRIRWLDADGRFVAEGSCQAILSWSGRNNSLMWAAAIPDFVQTEVPCLPPPDEETYQESVEEAEAEALARQAAQLVSAQFLYAAATGPESKLFLAIRNFQPIRTS